VQGAAAWRPDPREDDDVGIEHPDADVAEQEQPVDDADLDAAAALDYPLEADAADVAEQQQPVDDAHLDVDPDAAAALDYPLEADAADVADQHREIPLDEEGAR
jgi:hypothetical protein